MVLEPQQPRSIITYQKALRDGPVGKCAISPEAPGTARLPIRPQERFIVKTVVYPEFLVKGAWVEKTKDDWRDPKALGKGTTKADFDRNRDGIHGGLPKARLGSDIKDEEATTADFNRNQDGIHGGLPEVRLGLKLKDGDAPLENFKRTVQ